LLARVAVLEIGAAGAADQQRVAGKHPVRHDEAVGIVGVAGCVDHVERQPLDGELLAVGKPHRHHVGLGLLAHHGDAMGLVAERAQAGDVVGVHVGVDRLDELEVELPHQRKIAVDLLQDRIDDQRLAAAAAGEQIRIGAGRLVEQLAEDHGRILQPDSGGRIARVTGVTPDRSSYASCRHPPRNWRR
jgi:hypothetical protein